VCDAQLGHEKTLTGLMAALAGANVVYGMGAIEAGLAFDYAQLVLDNEFAEMIRKTAQGVLVSEETMALDVIAELAPLKDFLSHDHTLRHMRAQSRPRLIDRRLREQWEEDGARDVYERAWDEAHRLLDTYRPEPLPTSVGSTLSEIVDEFERAVLTH
jgi:trimethylamine---corrinoid protein Co-methyltransferase